MGLLKCADCGNDVSDQALACPKCGRPNKAGSAPIVAGSAQAIGNRGEEIVVLKPPLSEASIVSGIVQLLIAAWLQFSFLPAHDSNRIGAWTALGRGLQGKDTWVLNPGAYLLVEIIAVALGINGLLRLTVYSRKRAKGKNR